MGDGGCSLTICRETNFGTGRRFASQICGCSSVGRARPRHVSWLVGPRVRDSSSAPLRVCPFTPLPRDMVLAVRDVRDPRPEPRAARHHIRRDARVGAQPKWNYKNKEPSWSSRFEGGNRPQRLGGAGTRDRMECIASSTQWPECRPVQPEAAGSTPARGARTNGRDSSAGRAAR
jgi:hypothetical protein